MSSQSIPSSYQQVADGLEVFRDNAPALAYEPYDRHHPKSLTDHPLKLQQNRERRRICGVPVLWMIIAILIFVVGGAIGGGVGASVRLNEKSSSTSTSNGAQSSSSSTATATTTAPAATVTITTTINNAGCPYSVNNGTTYTSLTSTNYTIFCNSDVTPGTDIQVPDILGTSIYSCLDACTRYNENATSVAAGGNCVASVWAIYDPGNLAVTGKCFLKAGKTLTTANTGAISIAGVVQS